MLFAEKNGKVVFQDQSAEWWELYTPHMKCGHIAKYLNAAVRKAIRDVQKDLKDGMGLARSVLKRERQAGLVFDKYHKWGAADSEPFYRLRTVFRVYLHDVHGVKVVNG